LQIENNIIKGCLDFTLRRLRIKKTRIQKHQSKYNLMSVQFMYDSIVQYTAIPDSSTNSIALSMWNDSTF